MIKRFFCLIFAFILLFSLPLFSSAATYNAFGSLTSSSSQAAILISYYLNSPYFNNHNEYIVIRTGQNVYQLFTAPHLYDATVHVFTYQRDSDNEWVILNSDISNFSYNLRNYTAVGNVSGALASFDFENVTTSKILYFSLLFLIIISLFSIFRVKEHKYV